MKHCLFLAALLMGSAVTAQNIPISDPGFEPDPISGKANIVGNTWGDWILPKDSWAPAEPDKVISGSESLNVWRPVTLRIRIPKNLRGLPLEIAFTAAGEFDMSDYYNNPSSYISPVVNNKATGTVIRPLYSTCLKRTTVKTPVRHRMIFPAFDKNTTTIDFVLGQRTKNRPYIMDNMRQLVVDDFKVTALKRDIFARNFEPVNDLVWKGELNGADANAKNEMTADIDAGKYKKKSLVAAFRAEGNGTISATLMFNGNDVIAPVSAPPKKVSATCMPFRYFFAEIPGNAENVTLKFNTTGKVKVSDIRISSSEHPIVPYQVNPHQQYAKFIPPEYFDGRDYPIPAGMENLMPFADEIAPGDFTARTRYLSDGSVGTHYENPVIFRFPKAVKISEIRITIPKDTMLLYGDADGDGTFETVINEMLNAPRFSTWGNLKDYIWFIHKFEKPTSFHAIQYIGGAHEVRIIGPAGQYPAATALSNAPAFALGNELPVPAEAKKKDRLYFGFTLESWMFGIQGVFQKYFRDLEKAKNPKPTMSSAMDDASLFGDEEDAGLGQAETKKAAPAPKVTVPPLNTWKEWKNMMKDYKDLYSNFILHFPPSTAVMPPGVKPLPGVAYPEPVVWPSKVWHVSHDVDLLSQINEECNKHEIKNFVIPRAWSFHKKETKRLKQVIFAQEIAERKTHGVPVCVDEHQIRIGHTVKPEDKQAFFQWSGLSELPPKGRADTLAVRMGYLWNLKRVATWMAEIKDDTMKCNPEALTFGGFAGCDHYKNRFEYVSGHDAWGFEGKCDVIGGDGTYYGVGDMPTGTYRPGIQTAVQVACTPKRLSMATLNCNWGMKMEHGKVVNPLVYDDYPDVAYTAGPLVTYFNKGQYANFWRYNYIYMKPPATRAAVKKGGFMTKVLSSWGGRNAEIPKDVLVLRSRTSEDWWHLREEFRKDASQLTKKERCIQGFTQFFWTAANLVRNAVPYEIYAMHRPEEWKDIAKNYQVIILPFAYAISDAERDALKAAADAGVKIIAVGSYPIGTVDEKGEPRKSPALDGIPVTTIAFDPINEPATEELSAKFKAALFDALKAKGASLYLERDRDHDVQLYMLSVSDKEKLLLVVNWSERDTAVNCGTKLPAGKYKLDVCDGEKVFSGNLGGKAVFTEKDAASFRMQLKKEETVLMRIHAAE